jgi:hypothetical protein
MHLRFRYPRRSQIAPLTVYYTVYDGDVSKKFKFLGELFFGWAFPIRYGSNQNIYDEDNKAVGGALRVPFCGGWYAQRTLHLN